jgi:hypothetical protein
MTASDSTAKEPIGPSFPTSCRRTRLARGFLIQSMFVGLAIGLCGHCVRPVAN